MKKKAFNPFAQTFTIKTPTLDALTDWAKKVKQANEQEQPSDLGMWGEK